MDILPRVIFKRQYQQELITVFTHSNNGNVRAEWVSGKHIDALWKEQDITLI